MLRGISADSLGAGRTERGQALGIGLVLAAVLLSLLSSGLLLIQPSPWVQSILAGGVLCLLASLIFIERPLLCACCAILIVYFPRGIVPDRAYSLLIDTAIALALIGFLLEVMFRRRPIVWSGTTLLMGMFLLWCFITVTWTPDLIEARRQLIDYGLGILLLFLLHNLVDSRERLDFLMRALAAGGWILLMAGVVTLLMRGYEAGTRLKIGDVNENVVPTLLVVAFAGVLWGALYPRWLGPKLAVILSFIYLAGTSLFVALSGSRGGILSFALVLGLLALSRPTRRWTVFALCLTLVAALTAPFLFTTAIERFASKEGGELGGRTVLWESGLLLLNDHPFGAGLGNGKPSIPHYLYSLTSSEEIGVFTYRSTHNPVLDVGIDTGIPGMVLYGGAIAAAFLSFGATFIRMRNDVPLPRSYYTVVFCVLVGFLASWIRDGGMNSHPSIFIVLTLLALPARLHWAQPRPTIGSSVPQPR